MDRINELTKDCFNALIQLRQLDATSQPPPEVLHQRMRSYIDIMIRRGQDEMKFNRDEIMDITYAIVALADEIALSNPGAIRTFWMSRYLQLQYFNETTAGDNFFVRLQQIMGQPHKIEILRVYYLALMFGFQGRFRFRGGEVELGALTQQVEQILAGAKVFGPDNLSPQGERPAEALAAQRRDLPVVLFAGIAVGLSVLLYVGLQLSIRSEIASVVEKMGRLNQQSQQASPAPTAPPSR